MSGGSAGSRGDWYEFNDDVVKPFDLSGGNTSDLNHGMATELPPELAKARAAGDLGGVGTGGLGFQRQGMASKYSPILNQRGVEGGADSKERRKKLGQ